ncbi:MAG: histidine phosphatase family protein [Methylobacteriaceae bacterium]|nr:histidine phosphatase family protein [Methylobacteriaceae bacterium]MCC0006323.1 histidine phosphatase family protein [Methylobacteriaceae bacterium]
MHRLVLLRHSKAAREAGGGDRERPLTRRGREDAARVGRYLVEEKLIPNLAVVSDAHRTRETLECLMGETGRRFKTLIDPALYLAEDFILLSELHKTPELVKTMLVVCHNPGLADFAARMCGSGEPRALAHMRMKYPTSGLALIDFGATHWAKIKWGDGRLDRFVTPSTLVEGVDDLD